MREYLGEHDHTLCLVSEDTKMDEPVLVRRYYPIAWAASAAQFFAAYGEHKRGQSMTPNRLTWDYRDEDGLIYRLTHGGQTRPAHVEYIPVPCPKVRQGTPTRWNGYHWQKLRKAGWVPA